jgi:hypothetical protein
MRVLVLVTALAMSCSEEKPAASPSVVTCDDLMRKPVDYCAFHTQQLIGSWRFSPITSDALDTTCAPADGSIEFFAGDASPTVGTFTLAMRSNGETGGISVRTGTYSVSDSPEITLTFSTDGAMESVSLECMKSSEVLQLRDSNLRPLFHDDRWRVATREP